VENIVDFPFSRQHEPDSKWGNDRLNLDGTMILVVQFLRRLARFNVASVEHNQVSYLIYQGFFSGRISISPHSFLRRF